MPPVLLLAFLNPVADITVSRTVNSISAGTGMLTLAGSSCKSSDAYGSNDCVLDWGKSYTAAANGTLTKAIESGDTFTADFTVDELLPFKFTCQLCGVDCSFTLPVVRKYVSFAMPACPITAGAVHVSKSFTLPTSSPIPLKSGFKGTVIAQDKAGNSLASINVQQHVPRAAAPLSSARLCGSCASLARLVAWRSRVLLVPSHWPRVLERRACHVWSHRSHCCWPPRCRGTCRMAPSTCSSRPRPSSTVHTACRRPVACGRRMLAPMLSTVKRHPSGGRAPLL